MHREVQVKTVELPLPQTRLDNRVADLGFTESDLLRMYEKMLLARKLDERMWILQRQGKIAFVISGQGQEGAQVGAAYALRPGQDWLHPYYRDMAMALTIGMTPRDLLLACYGKTEDPSSGGRQMPAHYGKASLRIVTGSSPVATQLPQAAGIAYASKLMGKDEVTLTSLGEGSTSQGDFHEGLNFASVHRVPLIILVENNQYAISVPLALQMAVPDVADRAHGYGMPGVVVDGNDVLAVYEVTQAAHERARRGEGPTLIEAKTYRLIPHSSDDDDRVYRSREEVAEWRKRDPIVRFQQTLLDVGVLDPARDQELRASIDEQVNDATQYAEAAAFPTIEEGDRFVYADD
ncbi:MAG: thiamine pyrophosphate-dependent dehydrogenase E1 component subunit alpha [Anaerolineae bacterium]|nr:thiamine pyrophosphate-dependent dehydrogenase E1 component subunit alpha [Anaerolineae bacterium]